MYARCEFSLLRSTQALWSGYCAVQTSSNLWAQFETAAEAANHRLKCDQPLIRHSTFCQAAGPLCSLWLVPSRAKCPATRARKVLSALLPSQSGISEQRHFGRLEVRAEFSFPKTIIIKIGPNISLQYLNSRDPATRPKVPFKYKSL